MSSATATRPDQKHAAPKRAIIAWVLFDWAYGAFSTIVTTFVFATYYTQGVAADPTTGAAQWAGTQAIAGVLIALISVPLGAIADSGGRRRALLGLCIAAMVAATFGLWFVRPTQSDAVLALVLVGIGTVAFEVAVVFYNAMLPDLVAPARLGRLSGLAWGAGYAGGLVCLALSLVLLVSPKPPLFGLDAGQAEPVRATALLAGAWLALFSWPVVVFVPDQAPRAPWGAAIRTGLAEIGRVLRGVMANRPLRRFVVSRMLYIDGLTTLFAFGGIYAAGQFGLSAQDVLVFGIALNVTAGLGAALFAFIEDRIGPKITILVAVFGLAGLSLGLLLTHDIAVFWALGLALGVFVGPAQAASRSLMARMAPASSRGAYFGLFALSGRVTGFAGPLVLSIVTALTHSERAGMAVIVVFLALGAVGMLRVSAPRAEL